MTAGERLYKNWSELQSDANVIVVLLHREMITLTSLSDNSPAFESQLDMLVLMLQTVGVAWQVFRGSHCIL